MQGSDVKVKIKELTEQLRNLRFQRPLGRLGYSARAIRQGGAEGAGKLK